MRKGWEGFVEEQRRLAKNSLLWRPNWNYASKVPFDSPAWAEQTVTLQEKRRFYLEVAQTEASDRCKHLADQARRMEQKRQEAQDRLTFTNRSIGRLKDPTLDAEGRPLKASNMQQLDRRPSQASEA